MKKFLFTLSALTLITLQSFASDSQIPHGNDLYREDFQEVAKFFNHYMARENENGRILSDEDDSIISYQKDESTGNIFQISWYSDGHVITQLNGIIEGHQTVVWRGKVIGRSYPIYDEDGRIRYNYSWGFVTTRQDLTDINWKYDMTMQDLLDL